MPVPAPPPTIGFPAATLARSRARISERENRAIELILTGNGMHCANKREQLCGCRFGEGGIIDVLV